MSFHLLTDMRNLILTGLLSLWIFSILAPSIITIYHGGDETLMILCHNEEEQQESGKKDSVEEKIVSEEKEQKLIINLFDEMVPDDKNTEHSSNYIVEIHLPPPEQVTLT